MKRIRLIVEPHAAASDRQVVRDNLDLYNRGDGHRGPEGDSLPPSLSAPAARRRPGRHTREPGDGTAPT
jgi:hypothetical protein